jgi:hypothetical protein
MAAPSATTRVAPTGLRLKDGFICKLTFLADTNVNLFEIGLKPSGLDNGEPIPQNDQWNTDYRINRARALNERTPCTIRFHYDPIVQDEIEDLVGTETTITERYPDGSTQAYYGYLRSVEFDEMVEGTDPTGTATIQPTCWDSTNNVEAGPVVVEVAGT